MKINPDFVGDANDKLFPDGSKIVKIEWTAKKHYVPVFRDGTGHPESGCGNRKR
jgi:hypothetical protein